MKFKGILVFSYLLKQALKGFWAGLILLGPGGPLDIVKIATPKGLAQFSPLPCRLFPSSSLLSSSAPPPLPPPPPPPAPPPRRLGGVGRAGPPRPPPACPPRGGGFSLWPPWCS